MSLHVIINDVLAAVFGLRALIRNNATEIATNWLPSIVTLDKIRAGTAELRINQQASEDTGTTASEVLSAASKLSRQSVHLPNEVDRFLATVRAA